MKTITVRNVSDDIYKKLVEWSKISHRSLQEQVRYILEQEIKLSGTSSLERAKYWRRKLHSRDMGNIVADIRKDRKR